MWRYLAGGLAAMLMMAAGWVLFNGSARPGPLLPPQPIQAQSGSEDPALPDAAPEATARTREQKRFGRYDKDKDGTITRAEYLASRRKAYAKLDANGDGALSFDEWAVKTTTRFATADADKSASMNAAEFLTTAPKRSTRPKPGCPPPAAARDEGRDEG